MALPPWQEFAPTEQPQKQPPPWEEFAPKPAMAAPAAAPTATAEKPPWEEFKTSPSLLDYAGESISAIERGAANTVGSALHGFAAEGPGMAREKIAELEQMNTPLPEDASPSEIAARRLARSTMHPSQELVQQRIAAQKPLAETPVAETGLYKAGTAVEAVPGKSRGILNPLYEDVLGGVGSVGTNILTSMIPGVGPALATASALGQGSGEAAENAIASGKPVQGQPLGPKATEDQIYKAARLGTVPGATDLVDSLLPKLGTTGKVAGFLAKIGKVGLRALEGALTEGGQEGVQQLLQNYIARGIYDPGKDVMADVKRSALVGAIVGGGTTAILGGHGEAPATESPAKPSAGEEALDALTGGAGGQQLSLNLGQPNVQTAALHMRGTATDAPAVETPTQPPGVEPGQPVGSPTGGLPANSVAPGAAAPAVGTQTPLDNTVPTEYLPGMPGPEINPLTGAPKYPSLQENSPAGGVPGVFAGQRTIPQSDIGVRTEGPAAAQNENPDRSLTSPVRNAPRMIQAQVAAEPDPVRQRELLDEYESERRIALATDSHNTTQNLLFMDPAEEQIPGGNHVEMQGDLDFGPSASVVPNNIAKPTPIGNGLIEVAQTPGGAPYIINSLHTATVSDWVSDIHPDPILGEVHGLVHRLVSDRLQQAVPDVPVHVVSDEEFDRFAPPDPLTPDEKPLGLYFRPTVPGPNGTSIESPHHPPFILLRNSALENPLTTAWLVQHEATHAATARMIDGNREVKASVRRLMNEALAAWQMQSEIVFGKMSYAFTNEKEFIAEAFSNPKVQYVLANIPASRELRSELNLDGPRPTLWQALVRAVQRLFGVEKDAGSFSLLEATLRIGDRIIDQQAQLPLSPARPAQADFALGVRENRDAIRDEDPTADQLSAVSAQPAVQGVKDAAIHIFGRKPPPAFQHAAGHADRINWVYKLFAGLDQLARSNPHFRPLIAYMERVREMHLEEVRIHDMAVTLGKEWRRLGTMGDKLSGFIADVARMNYRSQSEVKNGVVRHPSSIELQKLIQTHGLSQEAVDLFNKITASIVGRNGQGGFLGLIESSIVTRITETAKSPQDAAARIQAVQNQVAQLRQRPYFPLTNFGKYYVRWTDNAGKLVGFQTVEGRIPGLAREAQRSLAKRVARDYQQKYGVAPVMGKDITIGVLPTHVTPMIGMPSTLLKEMGGVFDMTPAQINAASDLIFADNSNLSPVLAASYQKKFYVPGYGSDISGYSYDLRRSYARFFFHGAKYYTKTKYLNKLQAEVANAQMVPGNKEGEIARFMQDHLKNTVIDAKGDWGWAKGAIFMWSLGYVPAAASQNLSQMPMITFPFLGAKFGDIRATRAISKAMVQVSTFYKRGYYDNASQFEMRAFDYGIKTGRITETQAPELNGMAQNSLLQGIGGNNMARGWQQFMQGASWMFETAEQFNRRVTFRAALNLALENPAAKYINKAIALHRDEYDQLQRSGFTEAEARAIIAAADSVEQTQYVYARWARPKFMRGRLLGTIFVFKKYIQSTLFMLGQNPDVFWRYALISAFIGGASGLPFAEEFMSVISAIGKWYFGRDWNVKVEAAKYIRDVTGDRIDSDIVLHGFARKGLGIPAVLDMLGSFATGTPGRGLAAPRMVKDPQTGQLRPEGFAKNVPFPVLDRSRALGMGQVLPIDVGKFYDPGQDVNKTIAQQAQQASGAVFSVGFNIYKAIQDNSMPATDFKRWERAVPRLIGDISQAWRAFSEGKERVHGGPAGGTTVLTYNPRDPEQLMEILAIAAGYQPLRLQQRWDYLIAQNEAKAYWDLKRQGLLQAYHEAVAGKDPKELSAAQDAIRKFNTTLPDYAKPQAITPDTIIKSVTTRERQRAGREMGIPPQKKDILLNREIRKAFPEATIDVRRPAGQ